jgi:hypothetical protein
VGQAPLKQQRCQGEGLATMLDCKDLMFMFYLDQFDDDYVLNEDWIKYRMVRSHRLLSLVLVAIGVGRRISKRK